MKLVETKISESMVYMRYADNPDSAKATVWIDFQVPIAGLTEGTGRQKAPFGQLEPRPLESIQKAALLYARNAIDEEILKSANHQGA